MSIQGWYYLHTNGDLIYKRDLDGIVSDIRESDFARSMWPFDPTDRESAWRMLVEASALGAKPERVKALASLWKCDDADAQHFADRLVVTLELDGTAWCAKTSWFENPHESPIGFGDTCLEALADLCKSLGFTGGKMWNTTFKDLCIEKGAVAP